VNSKKRKETIEFLKKTKTELIHETCKSECRINAESRFEIIRTLAKTLALESTKKGDDSYD
jgi:hypothetical protein